MIVALFLTVYLVIALACVGLGLYLSEPGNTWSTLPGDVLRVLPRRSRPVPVEPKKPSFFEELSHSEETQYHVDTPPQAPTNDEHHEEPGLAMKIAALGEAIKSSPTLDEIHAHLTSASDDHHEEAEPAEAVHDEP